MPELADQLERHSRLVDLPTGGFERLSRRRDRRQRNRRISAAVLPIVIALLGITAFIRAFGHGPTPATRPTPIPVSTYRLAYERDGDIYVADANGANAMRVANGIAPTGTPACGSYGDVAWSPDGRYFAFRGECPTTVTIADPRGHIVASFRVGMGWHVSWSPDSTRVVVWAQGDGFFHGDRRIGIYGIDGLLQKVLTLPGGMFSGEYDPSWSPDGQSIFVGTLQVPIDGSPPRRVPARDAQTFCCAVASPDGTRAVYISGTPSTLIVSPIVGSGRRAFVADGAQGPVWSPSGDRIAYNVSNWNNYALPDSGPAREIDVVDVASGSVTSVVPAASGYAFNVLGFSPDGGRILYCRMDAVPFSKSDHNLGWELWSVGTDGSDPQLLVKGADLGAWQP